MRETSNAVCAGDGLAGDLRDLGHRERLPRPDIVFAGRQSLGFQSDDERFGDIVDMHIVIDELRIAGNFRDASGAGVADHRTEMAIGASIRAVYLVGRVVENELLPLSPPLRGERSGEGLG